MSVSNEVFALIAVAVFYYLISLKSNNKDYVKIEELYRFFSVGFVPVVLALAGVNIILVLITFMLFPIQAIVSFANGGIVKQAIRMVKRMMSTHKGEIKWGDEK
jgi:hypothetical protein